MASKTYPPIILGFFARGLNTNRQPLFSALTGVGLQVIQFKDYLVDGINVECTDRFTLQRAPGFTKYCSVQLAVGEKVNQFYSTRDLSGNVYTLADTNQHLSTVTPSALTSLLTKGTTAQGYIQQIGGVTYYANGTDLKKWIPPASSMVPWGIIAPNQAPAFAGLNGSKNVAFWTAATVFLSVAFLDYNGNIQYTAAGGTTNSVGIPTWATQLGSTTIDGTVSWENVGPIGAWAAGAAYSAPTVVADSNFNLQLVTTAGTAGATVPSWNATLGLTTTDNTVTWTNIGAANVAAYSSYSYVYAYRAVTGNLSTASPPLSSGPILTAAMSPISITAWNITTNVATFTATNSLRSNQWVELSGFPTTTHFNGNRVQVLSSGLSSSQFKANLVWPDGSGTEAGLATPYLSLVSGPSTSNSECNSTATITSVQVAAGIVTITAANNFTPGINVQFSGVGTATFLQGLTLSVSSATSTSFTVNLPSHANYGPAADTGTATFLAVEIYRTADGGGVYYFDGAAANGGSWAFFDKSTDAQLTTELTAPLAHQNDPPPAGTILAWWSNRIWMAVGNLLYFTGGPDILNGVPEECWPPGNVFVFPGTISSLNATTGGLIVTIPEELWAIVGGPQTFAYYPERILSKFGALSPNCVTQDGDTLYIHSSQKQLTVLSGAGKSELGSAGSGVSPVGDLLANGTSTLSVTASAWSATASYLTIHRQGEDSGIYLSNGVDSIIRYGLNVGNFSPVRQPFPNGPIPLYTDTFTRASLGASWGTQDNAMAIFASTDAGAGTAGGARNSSYFTSAIGNDQYVQATLTAVGYNGGVEYVGLGGRMSSSADTYYKVQVNGANAGLGISAGAELWKVVAGTSTSLTSAVVLGSLNVGDVLKLTCIGTTITGYINGVSVISATDSAIASGHAGIVGEKNLSGTPLMRLNNWSSWDSSNGPNAGAINSVETSPGQYSLLFAPTATHDYIYARDLTTFTDNGHAYPSNFVIGNIVVTEPGQPLAPLHYVTAYLYNRGSVPAVAFFPNDITPASLITLPTVQAEPVFLTAPLSLMSKRWPVLMNQSATAILVRHLQLKMDFGNTDTVKNELIELGLRFENEQML